MDDEPTPAQRARTVLAGALAARLRGPAGETDRDLSSVTISDDGDESERADATRTCVPVEVEVADAAPLPVRDRIRARVVLTGTAAVAVSTPLENALDGRRPLHLHVGEAMLIEGATTHRIAVTDLLEAEPDPLQPVEAEMLGHLEASHHDVVARLTDLLESRDRQGVVCVWPYRLDRLGLVLRLEYVRGHVDRRLPFSRPVTSPQQLHAEMHALIVRASARRARCLMTAATGPVADALRATPAAHRLCNTGPTEGPEDPDPSAA